MTEPIEVLVSQKVPPPILDDWKALSPRFSFRQAEVSSADGYRQMDTSRTEILYANGALPDDFAIFPRLRWIQQTGAGVDWTADHPIRQTDVTLTTAVGIHATPIAEYVFASILAWKIGFPYYFEGQQQKEWRRFNGDKPRILKRDLRGQTLGVIGYGSIGREVGRLGAGFGMTVLACNRRGQRTPNTRWSEPGVGDPDGRLPAAWYGPDQLAEMLPQCDIVAICAPLTSDTAALIGRNELALMKPTAYLVNIARGKIVDQDALIEALQAKRLGGAGLDVTAPEPLPPDSPLWHLDTRNILITPHISGSSLDYARRAAAVFKENLQRYLAGEPLLNEADLDLGY